MPRDSLISVFATVEGRMTSGGRRRLRFVSFFPGELCRKVWRALDYREDYDFICDVYCALVLRDVLFDAQSVIEACLARPQSVKACPALRGWE